MLVMRTMRNTMIVLVLTFILSCTLGATQLQLTGVNGEAAGGEYIGPYYVSVGGGAPQAMICSNFYVVIGIGQTWNANQLGWSDLTEAERPFYGAAYWLAESILDTPAPHAAAQWALWNLFAPTSPMPGTAPTMLAWANSQYAANPDWASYAGLVIWRPNPLQSSQEFITITDTPEMATFTYLGSGLLLLLPFGLRRQFRQRGAE